MIHNTVAIIMAGGAGSRLYPLTKTRAKPPFPLRVNSGSSTFRFQNCLNSDIRKMFILTQFNSESLNRHLSRTYFFAPFSEGFVQILAAQQTLANAEWYRARPIRSEKTCNTSWARASITI